MIKGKSDALPLILSMAIMIAFILPIVPVSALELAKNEHLEENSENDAKSEKELYLNYVGNVIISERIPIGETMSAEEVVFLGELSITELRNSADLPTDFEYALDLALQSSMTSMQTMDMWVPTITIEPSDPCFVWEDGYDGNLGMSVAGFNAVWSTSNVPSKMNIMISTNDNLTSIHLNGWYIGVTNSNYFIIEWNGDGTASADIIAILEYMCVLQHSDSLVLGALSASGSTSSMTFNWTVLDSHMWFDQEYYEVQVSNAGSDAVSISPVVVRDTNVIPADKELTFSLDEAYSGVSINSQTGQITVNVGAESGIVGIRAAYGDFYSCAKLVITTLDMVPIGISFQKASYSIIIPESGSDTISAVAYLINSSGDLFSGDGISYALDASYSGVSIDDVTGCIMVSSQAEPRTVTVTAMYDDFEATVLLNLINQNNGQVLSLDVIEGNTYYVVVAGSHFSGQIEITAVVSYDPEMINVLSSAAHVYNWGTQIGAVPNASVEVRGCTNGELRFAFSKAVPDGKRWSGMITVLEFVARGTGNALIIINDEDVLQSPQSEISVGALHLSSR